MYPEKVTMITSTRIAIVILRLKFLHFIFSRMYSLDGDFLHLGIL